MRTRRLRPWRAAAGRPRRRRRGEARSPPRARVRALSRCASCARVPLPVGETGVETIEESVMERKTSVVTPERFASGMTFEQYVAYVGTSENLKREGSGRPRSDMTAHLRAGHAAAKLDDAQASAIKWLAARPNGPAKVLVISEEWSSDCRRDVPMLARLAEAGGLELRIFNRDGKKVLGTRRPDPAVAPDANYDLMLEFLNKKNGAEWASLPVAVFYTKDFQELHRYIEYPAIYHKDLIRGYQQSPRPGETEDQARDRDRGEFLAMQQSPFFDVWASAGIDEILSALFEKLTVKAK